jgi:hypothetical protein
MGNGEEFFKIIVPFRSNCYIMKIHIFSESFRTFSFVMKADGNSGSGLEWPPFPRAKEGGMKAGSPKMIGLFLMMGLTFSHCARHPHLQYNQTYTYQYMRKGYDIGREVFVLERKGKHLVMKADLNIGDAYSYQRGETELVFRKDGKPMAYSRRLDVKLPETPGQNGLWELRYVFQKRTVNGEVVKDGSTQWKGAIDVGKGEVYCIDNNAPSLLAILVKAAYPELEGKAVYSVRAFHFSEARVRDVTFTKVRDGEYSCRIGAIVVGDLSVRDGMLLSIEHGDPKKALIIRLR